MFKGEWLYTLKCRKTLSRYERKLSIRKVTYKAHYIKRVGNWDILKYL